MKARLIVLGLSGVAFVVALVAVIVVKKYNNSSWKYLRNYIIGIGYVSLLPNFLFCLLIQSIWSYWTSNFNYCPDVSHEPECYLKPLLIMWLIFELLFFFIAFPLSTFILSINCCLKKEKVYPTSPSPIPYGIPQVNPSLSGARYTEIDTISKDGTITRERRWEIR
jgi:hypothetical protein